MNLNSILAGIGAALAFVIAVVIIWLCLANAHLKTELAEAESNVTACQLTNSEFADKVAQQDKAIIDMKVAAAMQEKRAADAEAKADKTARSYLNDASKLSARKAVGDQCKAADAILNTYLGGVR